MTPVHFLVLSKTQLQQLNLASWLCPGKRRKISTSRGIQIDSTFLFVLAVAASREKNALVRGKHFTGADSINVNERDRGTRDRSRSTLSVCSFRRHDARCRNFTVHGCTQPAQPRGERRARDASYVDCRTIYIFECLRSNALTTPTRVLGVRRVRSGWRRRSRMVGSLRVNIAAGGERRSSPRRRSLR